MKKSDPKPQPLVRQPFRCRWGFHAWSTWYRVKSYIVDAKPPYTIDQQARSCLSCGYRETTSL